MKPIMSLGRRDAILAMENKRTQIICALMENDHVDSLEEILRLVDRPVVTREALIHEPEDCTIKQIDKWYDLIATACRWLKNLNLTMTDHVPVHWYDAETQSMIWEYADELVFCIDEQENPYQGQRLYCSAIDFYALEVCEGLRASLLDCDTEEAKRLMEVIKQAIKEYI